MAHFLIGLPPSTVIVIDNHTKQFHTDLHGMLRNKHTYSLPMIYVYTKYNKLVLSLWLCPVGLQ